MGNRSSTPTPTCESWTCGSPTCQRDGEAKNSLHGLLIGKSGGGKSSTGNFILGKKSFPTSGGSKFKTTEVEVDWAHHCCYEIKVIDGPGLTEADLRTAGGTEKTITNMDKALLLCNGGVHVFLLVIKFGERFTLEMKETISNLEKIFGEDYLTKRGIIVVTGRDYFETTMKNDGTPDRTFMDWVQIEKSNKDFKKLVKKCDARIVLFNNFAEENVEIKAQIDKLFKYADELRGKGPYTKGDFAMYKDMRQELIKEKGIPILNEEVQTKVSLLLEMIETVCFNQSSPTEGNQDSSTKGDQDSSTKGDQDSSTKGDQLSLLKDDIKSSCVKDNNQDQPLNKVLQDQPLNKVLNLEVEIQKLLSYINLKDGDLVPSEVERVVPSKEGKLANQRQQAKLKPLEEVLKQLSETAAQLKKAVHDKDPEKTELQKQALQDQGEDLKNCRMICWQDVSLKRGVPRSEPPDMASAVSAYALEWLKQKGKKISLCKLARKSQSSPEVAESKAHNVQGLSNLDS